MIDVEAMLRDATPTEAPNVDKVLAIFAEHHRRARRLRCVVLSIALAIIAIVLALVTGPL